MVGIPGRRRPRSDKGIGGFANFMAVSFIMGLSAGVQAIAARRLGEDRHDILAVALNAGLVLAFVWAVPGRLCCMDSHHSSSRSWWTTPPSPPKPFPYFQVVCSRRSVSA